MSKNQKSQGYIFINGVKICSMNFFINNKKSTERAKNLKKPLNIALKFTKTKNSQRINCAIISVNVKTEFL